MGKKERGVSYAGLWIFALAFGWIEAAAVVYLRQIAAQEATNFGSVPFLLLSLPTRLITVEVIREACTLILLGIASWLASHRWAGRIGAFLVLFGVWDLAYYAGLRSALGWPESWTTWDILFLIPVPWVAPVWAPAMVAAVFVATGSYLFWTDDRPRAYGRTDIVMLAASAIAVVGAFLLESRIAFDRQATPQFPLWLFLAGLATGVVWFFRVERRDWMRAGARSPWLGVRVRAIPPFAGEAGRQRGPEIAPAGGNASLEQLTAEYEAAIAELAALADHIRDAGDRANELRERLILLGRKDVVQGREEFFQ